MEQRKCVVCGKEFMPIRGNQIVCSTECRRERDRALQKQWREKNIGYMSKKTTQEMPKVEMPKKKSKNENPKNLVSSVESGVEPLWKIEAEAWAHGMSYGQYVAKMGLK